MLPEKSLVISYSIKLQVIISIIKNTSMISRVNAIIIYFNARNTLITKPMIALLYLPCIEKIIGASESTKFTSICLHSIT